MKTSILEKLKDNYIFEDESKTIVRITKCFRIRDTSPDEEFSSEEIVWLSNNL